MKKSDLKPKDDEKLHQYCDRLAILAMKAKPAELRLILGEVSKWSYIHGSRDAIKVLTK